MLNSILTGSSVRQYREDDKLIEILARAEAHERRSLEACRSHQRPDRQRALARCRRSRPWNTASKKA